MIFIYFQTYLICIAFLGLAVKLSQCQECVVTRCQETVSGANFNKYPNKEVERAANDVRYNPADSNPRKKRDTYYQQPPKVISPGKVIVMPPPGQAPKGYPQPGKSTISCFVGESQSYPVFKINK